MCGVPYVVGTKSNIPAKIVKKLISDHVETIFVVPMRKKSWNHTVLFLFCFNICESFVWKWLCLWKIIIKYGKPKCVCVSQRERDLNPFVKPCMPNKFRPYWVNKTSNYGWLKFRTVRLQDVWASVCCLFYFALPPKRTNIAQLLPHSHKDTQFFQVNPKVSDVTSCLSNSMSSLLQIAFSSGFPRSSQKAK